MAERSGVPVEGETRKKASKRPQTTSYETPIPLTPSVRTAASRAGYGALSSWTLVHHILQLHPEYAGGRGDSVRKEKGPKTGLPERAPQTWINEVAGLFDPTLVAQLHGRLLILGLCELDPELSAFLAERNVTDALAQELEEDFVSLLTPERAGGKRYRNQFLKLVRGDGRGHGFLAVVRGGSRLRDLAELAHRQSWARSFTARYVLGPGDTLQGAVDRLIADVASLGEGKPVSGDLLPDPVASPGVWHSEVGGAVAGEPGLRAIGIGRTKDYLPRARLVLLLEWLGLPEDATAAQLGVAGDGLRGASELPEHVGVVLSGLPASVIEELTALGADELELPPDPEQLRSLPWKNDVPDGPDRLRLRVEVNALAEAIALEDMAPPMAVGVLGGWGAGKSFVLHMIEERIQEIRCEPVAPGSGPMPFVGHPYLIQFDAWTYAKGNLWASLMQRIFVDLDRQIALEQLIARELGDELKPEARSEVWRVISKLSRAGQERLRSTDLGRRALGIVARLDSGEATEARLWSVLGALKEEEVTRLREAERALAIAETARADTRADLAQEIDASIADDTRRSAWAAVGARLLQKAHDRWGRRGKGDDSRPPTFDEVTELVGWYRLIPNGQVLLPMIVILLAGAVCALVGKFEPIVAALTAAMSVAGAIWTGIARFNRWIAKEKDSFDEAVAGYRANADAAERLEAALSRARRADAAPAGDEQPPAGADPGEDEARDAKIARLAGELLQHDRDLDARKAEVTSRKRRVGMATQKLSVADFVRQRLESGYYAGKLGMLHQIKADLEDLSESLLREPRGEPCAEQLFPRGKPRIILMVDDLDRCPPDKVVEVLEAVQLLVKTPLFVVVLAMDVRYVTRALEKVYSGVLTRWGEPSGLDYIEKIIQIPYRVRPVQESAVGGFLRAQMSPLWIDGNGHGEQDAGAPATSGAAHVAAGADDGGADELEVGERPRLAEPRPSYSELRALPTRTQHFTTGDLALMSECCKAFDVSPRTMKRLVNVFKLLKIIWFRRGQENGPEESVKRAMLALLVIAARFPDHMRQLLHALERYYGASSRERNRSLADYLVSQCREARKNALLPDTWAEVEAAVGNHALIADGLTLGRLGETNLRLVSTFSFVGEHDPERQATLRNDLSPSWPVTDRPPSAGATEAPN